MSQDLYLLWTSGEASTAHFMVLQYATGCVTQDWWDSVTVILWGASLELAANDRGIQERIKAARHAGVAFTACRAAARQMGVTDKIEALSIPLEAWGPKLTRLLQEGKTVLAV